MTQGDGTMIGLCKVGETYYLRWRIPAYLQSMLGKKEIKKSLGTCNFEEASLLIQSLQENIYETIDKIDDMNFVLDEKSIDRLISKSMDDNLRKAKRELLASPPPQQRLRSDAAVHNHHVLTHDIDAYEESALELLSSEGVNTSEIDTSSLEFKELCYKMMLVKSETARIKVELSQSGSDMEFKHPQLRKIKEAEKPVTTVVASTTQEDSDNADYNSEKLSVMFDIYAKEKKNQIKEKTLLQYRQHLSMLIFVLGDIESISLNKKEVSRFKQMMLEIPAHRHTKYPKHSAEKLVEVCRSGKDSPMSSRTINNHILSLRTISAWAHKNGYMKSNPFSGMVIKGSKKKSKTKNLVYDAKLLKEFFSTPAFHGRESHARQTTVGDYFEKDSFYWYPLIGLYAGMRIEEICNMEVKDVYQKDGVWIFDVNEDGHKSLKTAAATRIIPIHSKLLEAGLIKHLNLNKRSKSAKLWDEKPNKFGNYGLGASKRLGLYRKRLDVPDTHTFHSFRATFIDALKQTGQQLHAVKALVGHEQDDLTFDGYAGEYKAEALKEVIETIQFDIDYRTE